MSDDPNVGEEREQWVHYPAGKDSFGVNYGEFWRRGHEVSTRDPATRGPDNMAELPKYRCHKTVHALKIKDVIVHAANGHIIVPEDTRYAPFQITDEYLQKHKPESGGYFVQYNDGYKSFSPAQPFEEGYELV
jgi:hypothetical protein